MSSNNSSDWYVNAGSSTRENYHLSDNFNTRRDTDYVNISNSTLEPTAQEFYPSSQSNFNNGAVKKNNSQANRWNGRKNSRYGSGRTFNSGSSFYGKNDRAPNNKEQSKVLSDTARYFEGNLWQGVSKEGDNQEDDSNSVSSSNAVSSKENKTTSRTYTSSYTKKFNKNPIYKNSYNTNSSSQKYNEYENHKHENESNRNFRGNGNSKYGYGNSYRSNSNSYVSSYEKNNFYDKENTQENVRDFNKYSENKYQDKHKENWRNRDKNNYRYGSAREVRKRFDAASQRERLVEMINRRVLECLVCCEKIRHNDKVWSCMQCYHILHLNCVVAWAESSKVENGWRCPACQNVCAEIPKQYKCYCGKSIEPKNDPNITAHACGEVCLRKGRNCEHICTILCHPGPCPDCNAMVAKSCGCGATSQVVKCSTDIEIVCDSICNKTLECGVHKCAAKCHSGSCGACSKTIIQECYCAKTGRKVPCTSEHSGSTQYSCENICEKLLSCGNHKCQEKCHDGPCNLCERDVSVIRSCPCGKTPLQKPRLTCLDPIPCCDKICNKVLRCGQPSAPHRCKEKCHESGCPPCPMTTTVRCRCGHMDKEIPCRKLTTKADDARCEKKCTKKRLCGRHKCNQRCCIEIEHVCPLPCNHQLSCGQHRCELTCHSNRCPPCMETSFEELYCECGASVIYPPVPCGTKPPTCNKPCTRSRPCGHDANHNCHTGPCPPCFVLTKRWCYGHHEQRAAIPCSQETFSCGLPCGKQMPCGKHRCAKPCHDGDCPLPCRQPCTVPRALCSHPCNKPCHDPPCPESSCKQLVPVTCTCGLQKSTKPCIELIEEFRNIEMMQLKEKMGDLAKDQTIDISDLIFNQKKPSVLKILECNEECRVVDRNRRLAIGLQIRNPDLSQKLTPRYTDFMRNWAKKDPLFCQKIHEKLTELVQLAKQSKQKSRSYSFESMNRDKRHFVHEYCEHFGIDSAAYDTEPNRNVVATAIKDKSWLPSMSLLEVIQRENGQRKVPGPVLAKGYSGKSETVSLKLPGRVQRPGTPPGEVVDYFDSMM